MTSQQDIVIEHVRNLLETGKLSAGDKLPAERRLAEELGISRVNVRAAYQKLEIYGVAETYPQSGTVIKEFNHKVLTSQMAGIVKLDRYDFMSLVHVRLILELEAVKLAVKNATEGDIANIQEACRDACTFQTDEERSSKDFAFHQAVARASHNPVIASLLLVITPDVITYFKRHRLCSGRVAKSNEEHQMICNAIAARDAREASRVLRLHLHDIVAFSKKQAANQARQ